MSLYLHPQDSRNCSVDSVDRQPYFSHLMPEQSHIAFDNRDVLWQDQASFLVVGKPFVEISSFLGKSPGPSLLPL